MQSYASLQEGSEPEESGVLIHVVESSRSRWNHVEDLDSFFSRMYRYHQHSGFYVMLIEEILELFQFVFVVFLGIIILHGINYVFLFDDKSLEPKIPFEDLFYRPSQWLSHCGWVTYLILVVAAVVWGLRLIRGIYLMFHYWDIKQFYNSALSIDDSQLSNLTWHEVQTKIRAVQLEQQMCIHKRELTELDIYHRILRQQNYFVAMANKRLLPPRLYIPFIGEVVYWTRGLRYNMQLLLFWGPWAPFQNPWHLKEEYRKPNLRHELAHKLKKYIFWLAIVNLIFAPFVFLWQILYVIFSYAELVKREPGSLGIRGWSLYGRLYLRHFNELEHELQARLNRAYRPATRYLAGFNSPMVSVVARGLVFTISGILFIIAYLGFLDQDILKVSYYLPILAVFSALFACFRALIPDETMAWCPETLLTNVLVHTHYLPPGWRGQAHTDRVRKEFQQLLQYTFVRILDAIFNPILTPVVLITYVYPRALDIVDFFRNFTVSVVGVGDVCSFAQMDVRKHGNPEWQWNQMQTVPDQYTQAEDGKTELSLVHFTLTNPSWHPPPEAQNFVQAVQQGSIVTVPERSSGDGGPFHFDLNDSSTYGSYQRREGPPNSDFNSMSMSTRYLHDQHFRQVGSRYQRPAVETTPLLSSN